MIFACVAKNQIFAITGNIHLAREAHRLRAKGNELLKNMHDVFTADEHKTLATTKQELLIFDPEIEPAAAIIAEDTRALIDRIANERTVAE